MSLETLELIDIHPIKLEDSAIAAESLEESGLSGPVKRKKCGEIYLEEYPHFSLVCAVCKDIYFDLSGFATHYLKEHVDNEEAADSSTVQNDPKKTDVKSKGNIREFKIEEPVSIPEFIDICNPELEERPKDWETTEEADTHFDDDSYCDRLKPKVFCDVCRKSYASQEGLRKHTCQIERAKPKPEQLDSPDQLNRRPKRNRSKPISEKCAWCDKVHSSLQDCENDDNPDEDEAITHPDLYCEICSRQFDKRNIFRRHALHQHTTPPEALKRFADYLQCMFCHRKFTDIAEWRTHEEKHKYERKPYICRQCPKGFSCRTHLLIHIQSHTGEKPHKCDQCSLTFACPQGLALHKSTIHLKLKPFACKLCDKKYSIKTVLLTHIKREHTGEKPFQCETCGKCFLINGLLQQHRKRHTNTRNSLCTFCSKAFFDGQTLRRHMRIHSDTKHYKCKICGKEFAQAAGLYAHKKTHRKTTSNESSS